MVQRRSWAIALFVAIFGMTSSARAERASVTTLRDGIDDLNARTKVIQPHIERGPPKVRAASEQAMSVVERDRASLTARLAVIDLLGEAFDEGGPAIREMTKTMEQAAFLLAMVERWYSLR